MRQVDDDRHVEVQGCQDGVGEDLEKHFSYRKAAGSPFAAMKAALPA
jgi:hypothetical protein